MKCFLQPALMVACCVALCYGDQGMLCFVIVGFVESYVKKKNCHIWGSY